ncbi:lysozyme inhibitor [Sandaracinobacter neustonicus]|uniref:Lysozyme inhibitor n=1 Tax=Sandaracinobacter neustonicus TaxID=1715348 RepID=A0A501XK17_9SPHN|nr:MliC family protein [Sandaracinobacter neustonicus]TPE60517.1 lysozyme inhibitor [Sandaracinobacter neustonicus]
MMMKFMLPLLAGATVLAACSTPSTPSMRPAPVFAVNYRCANGEAVTIRYFDEQGTAVLVRGGQTTELNRVSSTPLTYQGGQTTVIADAGRMGINLTVGAMATTSCQATSASGRPPAPPTAPPISPTPPVAPPPPTAPTPPAEMRVSYNCSNGEQISVRYFPQQGVASLSRGGQNTELQQQVTPPGFTYTGPSTVLRVADDRMRLTMTVGMMSGTNCTAA